MFIISFDSHAALAWVSPKAEPETKAHMQEVYLGSGPREQPGGTSEGSWVEEAGTHAVDTLDHRCGLGEKSHRTFWGSIGNVFQNLPPGARESALPSLAGQGDPGISSPAACCAPGARGCTGVPMAGRQAGSGRPGN